MKKVIIIIVLFFSTQVFNSCIKQDEVSEQIKMEQLIQAEDGDWNGGDVGDDDSDSDEEEDEE